MQSFFVSHADNMMFGSSKDGQSAVCIRGPVPKFESLVCLIIHYLLMQRKRFVCFARNRGNEDRAVCLVFLLKISSLLILVLTIASWKQIGLLSFMHVLLMLKVQITRLQLVP
ncbi:hypothetical protein Droror1_Dr00020317 [Drosera rotundifolia]